MSDKNAEPEISVVMSVRNGAPFLQSAIDSILHQECTRFEFLIVDDGSTDETREILRRQGDPRIRVFYRDSHGLPASLNFAVQQSRAELIARQDADDLSEPARLDCLFSELRKKPEAALVHSACFFDSESGAPIPTQYAPTTRALMALQLCVRNPIVHGSVLFRKSAFQQAGGYNEEFLQSQDYDLWSRMMDRNGFGYCHQKLYRFRIHGKSVSVQKSEAQKAFARRVGLNNCRKWFRTDEKEIQRIYEFLCQPARSQSPKKWLDFIRHDLARFQFHSAELYFWAAIRLMRAFRLSRSASE